MNRIDRLFGITTMLQSKKYVAAEQIAEKFEISVRTVYRDIRALSEQGIPVSFEQNKGYFLVQGYFLPPVSFTQEEANALLLMEKVIYRFTDRSIYTHYSTALNKVKAVLRGPEKEKMEQLAGSMKTHVPAATWNSLDHLATLQSAITGKYIIEIAYSNKSDIASKRQLEPIGLVFYAEAWHLIAWCHMRCEYRDFKVIRISQLISTNIPFKKDPHISLTEYVAGLQIPSNPQII